MSKSQDARIRTRVNTYAGYSISSAAVWVLILALGERRLDRDTKKTLRLSCAGWWSGWTSATIARAGYPPPKSLSPRPARGSSACRSFWSRPACSTSPRLLATGKRAADTSLQQ